MSADSSFSQHEFCQPPPPAMVMGACFVPRRLVCPLTRRLVQPGVTKLQRRLLPAPTSRLPSIPVTTSRLVQRMVTPGSTVTLPWMTGPRARRESSRASPRSRRRSRRSPSSAWRLHRHRRGSRRPRPLPRPPVFRNPLEPSRCRRCRDAQKARDEAPRVTMVVSIEIRLHATAVPVSAPQ